ncbi:FkbM family methyltransferase [Mucilaginibacter sp.]
MSTNTTINALEVFRPYHIDNLKRLGNDYDGGYIVHYPSLLDAECLVNYGVGYNVAFEKDFWKETGKPTYAFDPTLSDLGAVFSKLFKGNFVPFMRHAKNYLVWMFKKTQLKKSGINFIAEGISDTDTEQYKTFDYHFKKYNLHNKKFIFKIDVEGAEYPVFGQESIYPLLGNAVQVLLEFHYADQKFNELLAIMNKMEETHTLIHLHANNHGDMFDVQGKKVPAAFEATFIHNSYLPVKTYSTASYPIEGLDQPCDRLQKDVPLDFFY